ncbi:MAG: hypothetical protein IPJ56_20355 [Gemmatimonadetes bacterium]|nr:hypothetical protein [Gemmatimonadota bacterium]
MGDFALPVQDVDRDDDHPELHAGQEEIDELGAIGEVEREAISRLHAATLEEARQAVAARVERTEGQRLDGAIGALVPERGDVAAPEEREVEQVEKLHGGANLAPARRSASSTHVHRLPFVRPRAGDRRPAGDQIAGTITWCSPRSYTTLARPTRSGSSGPIASSTLLL